MTLRLTYVAATMLGLLAFALPVISHAQTAQQDELHAAILSSLLADPRAAGIPPAQMQALVDALAVQAQAQHLTAADVLWRPRGVQSFAASDAVYTGCGTGFSGYLCEVSASFGFGGDDMVTPALIFATSGLLIVVIRRMRINARALAATQASTPPWAAPM